MTVLVEAFRPEPDTTGPRYLQLVERITAAIEAGQLRDGEVLPPERQLCEALGVSRTTLRKAIEVLTARRLIVSRQGSGHFVSPQVTQLLTQLSSFSDDMRARGWQPGGRVLSSGVHAADAEEAAALALAPEAAVLRLVRLRLADGVPLGLERAAVPAGMLPAPATLGDSLYAALAAAGRAPVRAVQHLRAAAATAEDARQLRLAPGDPVMQTARTSYLPDGTAVEFTRSVYRGDKYDFVVDLR